ncbi:hypothetical protein FQN60_000113 [Etheostoma spectabile]|uniref:Uncharacterized protein n=1 Tax=Etheostoma spectabile TaxID=54343 RepID=A0A5J5CB28_9PERO|nr:hypothetical protein FQN60_000113 [Etheostoma spectabile]
MLFPSLKDPYSKKGYEHFYDAASSTGYISWRLKTLDGDACQEAMSLLNHTTDNSLVFQKMRETFQHRQKLVNDPGRSVDILSSFPRFLDTQGLVDQDFTLLFDDETSSRLLQKWDLFFKPKVMKEAKRLTSTPELRRLVQSAESPPGSDLDDATKHLRNQRVSSRTSSLLGDRRARSTGSTSPWISVSSHARQTAPLGHLMNFSKHILCLICLTMWHL